MKVLLTGGLGYIGSHTAVELQGQGFDIVVLDNLHNSDISIKGKIEQITGKPIKFYKADILNEKALDKIFKKEKFDAVIHFAGLKAVGESVQIPLTYYNTNITGTANVLKTMQKHGVRKFVFSSTACVYPFEGKSPVDETVEPKPYNPYGRTKYFIEEMLKDLAHSDKNFEITILRYFNPIGAHDSGLIGENPNGIPNNLLPYVTRVATGKLEKLTIFGKDYETKDGTCVRDFIHVVDLARGHIKALEKIKPGIEIYNLGTGTGYSVLEVVTTFNRVCGDKVKFVYGKRREGDVANYFANPSKAQKHLKFKTNKTLEEMCKSAYNFEINNK